MTIMMAAESPNYTMYIILYVYILFWRNLEDLNWNLMQFDFAFSQILENNS